MIRNNVGKLLMVVCFGLLITIGSSINEEHLMLCVMEVDLFGASPSQCLWVIEAFGPSKELLNTVKNDWTLVGILSFTSPEVLAMAQLFIDHGIDVNAPQIVLDRKLLPIHSSILSGELEAFNLLIENGADILLVGEVSHGNALQFAYLLQDINPVGVREEMIAVMEALD
ncbi:putative Ankyrin repeat protein [Vibrio tapetis subsp. tapetis]|uniref:Putative Ankyrin repeat protein n=2 Tax=Vibrio tapetis TaxID=52443 RepID=A0A2N8Z9H5_9VIBR|nr:putative Ankyrin repeat protein [Vibrio tapetis subsp. tapetis]